MSNVYRENGYNDREDYLSCIAEDYDPTSEALALVRQRIAEKIALKPAWYRYEGNPMSQSKLHSLTEAVVNTLVGLVIAMLATALICWFHDIPMLWGNNFKITAWMTALSVVRSYVIRRYFNRKDTPCSTS